MRYSHQFLIAVTVESAHADPDALTEKDLTTALAARFADILEHDGIEAFSHNDTEEIDSPAPSVLKIPPAGVRWYRSDVAPC